MNHQEALLMSAKKSQPAVWVATIAIVGALGAAVRLFVRIVVFPGLELTPGFMFSELGGLLGGVPGGVLTGVIVGMGGAIAGVEEPVLPIIGNICLGIGTGIASRLKVGRDSWIFRITAMVGAGLIGGFIPTYLLFSGFQFQVQLVPAVIDGCQAILWAAAALVVERTLVRPILGPYLYPEPMRAEAVADSQVRRD